MRKGTGRRFDTLKAWVPNQENKRAWQGGIELWTHLTVDIANSEIRPVGENSLLDGNVVYEQ